MKQQHQSPAGAKTHKIRFPMVVEIDDNIYPIIQSGNESVKTDSLKDENMETPISTYTENGDKMIEKAK